MAEVLTRTSVFCRDGFRFGHSCGAWGEVEMEALTTQAVVEVEA